MQKLNQFSGLEIYKMKITTFPQTLLSGLNFTGNPHVRRDASLLNCSCCYHGRCYTLAVLLGRSCTIAACKTTYNGSIILFAAITSPFWSVGAYHIPLQLVSQCFGCKTRILSQNKHLPVSTVLKSNHH